MFEYDEVEKSLLGSRKNLREVLYSLGIDAEEFDRELMTVDQCTHCNVWHYSFKLKEDLDGNPICKYCEELVGR